MADPGFIRSRLGGLPETEKRTLSDVFEYVLANLRVGLPGHQKRAENFQHYQLDGITSSVANQEFSIAHSLAATPRVLFPCLDLTSSGTQMVPLTCSRVADANRIYLRSPSTSAAFTVFVEGR